MKERGAFGSASMVGVGRRWRASQQKGKGQTLEKEEDSPWSYITGVMESAVVFENLDIQCLRN